MEALSLLLPVTKEGDTFLAVEAAGVRLPRAVIRDMPGHGSRGNLPSGSHDY